MKPFVTVVGWFFMLNLSVLSHLNAQQPDLRWARSFGSPGIDFVSNVSVDQEGNVYSIGGFSGVADFDPGPDVFTLSTSGPGLHDIFVSKLDALGNFVWAFSIHQGIYLARAVLRDIVLDPSGGYFYISGIFSGTTDFDPGPGVQQLTASSYEVFIAKYSTDGDLVWVRKGDHISPNAGVVLNRLLVDNDGAPYLYANFNGSIDFDPGPGTHILHASDGDVFVWKLDANGTLEWANALGEPAYAGDMALGFDEEASNQVLYLSGSFSATINYPSGTTGPQLAADSGMSYLLKLSLSGQLIWAKNFLDSGLNNGSHYREYAMTSNVWGEILMSGNYADSPDADPGPDVYSLPYVNHLQDDGNMFISKLSSEGHLIWSKAIAHSGGTYPGARALDMVCDTSGAVYITGHFSGENYFDQNSNSGNLVAYQMDAFLLKMDSSGQFEWVLRTGGHGAPIPGQGTLGISIDLDVFENIYIGGYFNFGSDLDPGADTLWMQGQGNTDGFIQKLGQCSTAFDTLYATACHSYSLGVRTFDSSGWYAVVLPNSAGDCDSIVSLNLSIQPIDPTVLQSDDTLIAQSPNAAYQWLDCNNGFEPIPGATSPNFVPDSSGDYAVIISYADCVDTSACMPYQGTGIRKLESRADIEVYPNPAEEVLQVEMDLPGPGDYALCITNLLGQQQFENKVNENGKQTLDVSALPAGLYFIQLRKAGQLLGSKKFIKR